MIKRLKKESNVRMCESDRLLAKEMAQKEGRTLKGQLTAVINFYYYKFHKNKS